MSLPTHVVVHPLVLLSVVDHYNRVSPATKSTKNRKRVVGVLLGEIDKQGRVDITNSYAGTKIIKNQNLKDIENLKIILIIY